MIDAQRDALEASARRTLAERGKTFAWASRALGVAHASRVARLYAFCRRLDDLVDDKPLGEARAALANARRELDAGCSGDVVIASYIELAEECGFDPAVASQLILGFESDLAPVRMQDENALIRYAYRVAGTVGLMLCDVFDVEEPAARPFAVDLGIAMQLTNVARDVVEDARIDRLYLPRTRIPRDLSPRALVQSSLRMRLETRGAVRNVLALAERYYRSADVGMIFLPLRARLATLTASRNYEAIGSEIRRQRDRQWGERAFVSRSGRLKQTLHALAAWHPLRERAGRSAGFASHDPSLHRALRGLPGVDPRS